MKRILLIILALSLIVGMSLAEEEFSDIDSEKWYSEWVGIIKDLRITSGYPDGTFRPDNNVSV